MPKDIARVKERGLGNVCNACFCGQVPELSL